MEETDLNLTAQDVDARVQEYYKLSRAFLDKGSDFSEQYPDLAAELFRVDHDIQEIYYKPNSRLIPHKVYVHLVMKVIPGLKQALGLT